MPGSAQSRLLAAQSLLEMVEEMIDGATIVDDRSRVVWFNPGQLALLGGVALLDVVGQEIERVIPHSRLREVVETGRPQPLDVIQYGDKTLLVTRLPLRGEGGEIIGAFAFALKNSIPHLRPHCGTGPSPPGAPGAHGAGALHHPRPSLHQRADSGRARPCGRWGAFCGGRARSARRCCCWRDRDRQGDGGPCHPRRVRADEPALRRHQCGGRCRKA